MSSPEVNVLAIETFRPTVGQTYEVVFPDGRLPLTLAEARPLGTAVKPGMRAPFALTFRGKPGLRLPQYTYRLENAALGELDIFIVQIGDDAEGAKFEAIFT
jgi:hypothetical protein